jgi:thymidylate kinase
MRTAARSKARRRRSYASSSPYPEHTVSVPDRKAATRQPTIALVREVCVALAGDRVRYCHFKRNAFLDRSRTGDKDLDLLIARADEDRFSATMHGLGFKLAHRPDGGLPGILDYYGYDSQTGRIIHVHAHYQLVVGDDLTMNYRIPLEDAFLGAAREDGEFLVPPPELELILLVIRLALRHLTWDAVVTRRARVPASSRAELAFLQERVEEDQVDRLLEQWLPFVDERTFRDCRLALAPDAGRGAGIRAGGRLVTALKPCARRSRAADVSLKMWRRGTEIVCRLTSRPAPRKQLAAGGAIVAIVGADGAGKSTAVEELSQRLGKIFAVTQAHLGKPPKSPVTMVIRNGARARSVFLRLLRLIGARSAPSRSTEHAVLATALARDRYLAFRRIRRIATNGGLVICDRFPLRELTLMDGPRVQRVTDPNRWRRLTGRLAARERRYYRAITPPDVLIVLRVDPETAVARTDEAPDFVRARWREVWAIDWTTVPAHVIDAGEPRREVLSRLEALIWSEV